MLYVTDAINRIDQFTKELTSGMQSLTNDVAGVFLQAKLTQIKTSGIGQYSSKRYPAYFLKGKELNSSGGSFIDAKIKANQRINWADLRQAQGLQVGFVDVYYSGQMLNSTGIDRNNSASYRYYAIIGGRNDEARKKLYQNSVRYGSFLYPTPDQSQIIGNRALILIGNYYKRILLT